MMGRTEVVVGDIVGIVSTFLSYRLNIEVLSMMRVSHGNISTCAWFTTAHNIILHRSSFAVFTCGEEVLKRCVWLTLQIGSCHI